MSLKAVKDYFAKFDMEDRIIVLERSTATVEDAAREHDVDPDQIGKTLAFKLDETPILVVVAGKARIDNRKYKQHFSRKAKMLNPDEVLQYTGHAIGGVCPFGLPAPLPVYLDISIQKHREIIPAAGDRYSAIRLSIAELEQYARSSGWVDVCG